MPDYTPIFGFEYPCPDETISPAAFSTLANQIDAKLLELQGDNNFAINRPNFDHTKLGTPQTIPNGVDTVLTQPETTYTVTTAGVWMFRGGVATALGAAVTNMYRLRVRQNGVVRAGVTQNTDTGTPQWPFTVPVPMVAAVGDVITLTFLYNGTLTLDVTAFLSGKLWTRIP